MGSFCLLGTSVSDCDANTGSHRDPDTVDTGSHRDPDTVDTGSHRDTITAIADSNTTTNCN